jgi:hypothetical protein
MNTFAMIDRDTSVYFLMTDRFANGDVRNDVIGTNPSIFDPQNLYRNHGGDFRGIIDHLDYIAGQHLDYRYCKLEDLQKWFWPPSGCRNFDR